MNFKKIQLFQHSHIHFLKILTETTENLSIEPWADETAQQ